MWKKLLTIAELIKIEHTLFSLPFAYVGGILAADGFPTLREMFLITLAVFAARSSGMAFNRFADRYIDERNPRSQARALPEKRISASEVLCWTVFFLLLLVYVSWQLNPICLTLFPIAVIIIFFYSYTKRFTWLSHIFLGISLSLAPVGAWIGVRGNIELAPILLGLGVTFWTSGFDIIYATMDMDFDLNEGLHSIPARFGLEKALQISFIFHILAFILFVSLKFIAGLGWYYLMGLWIIGFLLYRENRAITPCDLSQVNKVFFKVNSLVSITILIFIILDVGL